MIRHVIYLRELLIPPDILAKSWRESSAMDGKHWGQHNATINVNRILVVPAGMTGGVSSYSFGAKIRTIHKIL